MIKANELRIGNKIIANGLHEGKILTYQRLCVDDTIIFFKEHQTGEYLKDCNPIPLTPDILEKAGFRERSSLTNNHWLHYKNEVNFWVTFILKDNERGSKGDILAGNDETKIKYLHQLQNLYFSLTGEELEIKL